ncbi:hypothetical protein EIP91_003546 [Steccherinum ochraceum]|uniref:Uncharacterized protein n=1 Tax=Steccherinum ochraceum TaxID=92696 RepID=A0A4R0RAD8_9APHY|nr:hypothetical protein EIP91_003546 [Steccherinum ochraceum]
MEQPQRLELPPAFEDVDVDILAELIGDMMQRLLAHNDNIPLSPEALTRFHSRSAPSISVLDYLRRIVKFTNVECTREVLQEYYINLVRTHSSSKYFIPDPLSSSGVSSDSDADMDYDVSDSRPSSPSAAGTVVALDTGLGPSTASGASTILIDTSTLSPEPPRPPTMEQNMAFAAFQQQYRGRDDGDGG